jgi:hypothetical protein
VISAAALLIYGVFYYCLYRAYEAFQWRRHKRLVPDSFAPIPGPEHVRMVFEMFFASLDTTMGKGLRRMLRINRFIFPIVVIAGVAGLMFGI